MSEHLSPWLADLVRPPWPSLADEIEVDVVVIGAGIFGATAAALIQDAGYTVALLEAEQVGDGTTGHTTGKLTSQHGLTYRTLMERHGREAATTYAEVNQRAIDDVEDAIGRMGIDCGFERLPSYLYTRNEDRRRDLEAEHAAAEELGLPASLTTDVDLPFAVEVAIRFEDQAVMDVGPYLIALARRVAAAGGLVFEHARVTKLTETKDSVTAHTNGGRVRARSAVVGTLVPFMDRSGFFARMSPLRSYGIAARLGSGRLEGIHINVEEPTRSTRPWRAGDGEGIVVVGEGHRVGGGRARPNRWGELERWARQHFDVASFEYRWSSQDFATVDHMPYVGRAPLTRHVYVATGFRKWGLTNGTAAAHMIADLTTGRPNAHAAAFDPARLGGAKTLVRTAKLNAQNATGFAKDLLRRRHAPELEELELGEGGVVRADGRAAAVYRTPDGELHGVSPTCTHLGCTTTWNDAERSWDCPCHGSRFGIDGRVLDGPATEPLDQRAVERDEP